MNCKPNDLAMLKYVPGLSEEEAKLNGMIIRVTRLHEERAPDGMVNWCYEGPPLGGYEAFRDDVLRPLADPGDDEVDERDVPVNRPVTTA